MPGTPCTDTGQNYARYLRIYRLGVLDAAGLAAVSKAAPYITAGTIVPDARLHAIARMEPSSRAPTTYGRPAIGVLVGEERHEERAIVGVGAERQLGCLWADAPWGQQSAKLS